MGVETNPNSDRATKVPKLPNRVREDRLTELENLEWERLFREYENMSENEKDLLLEEQTTVINELERGDVHNFSINLFSQ